MKTEHETLTVRMPSDMKAELEKRAKAEDLTVSQFVRRHFTAVLPLPIKPAARGAKKARAAA